MCSNAANVPDTQYALQLVGADRLRLNRDKPVSRPGPHQLLLRVEAVGLCFSDLKLLKQFADHPRKGPIISGIDPGVLAEIPSYVPGDAPTVPGHETVCRIVAVGDKVRHHRLGQRVTVQADYRPFHTAGSNAAFGYNFEGALQEYFIADERIVVQPDTQQRYLIDAPDELSASAIALVEPWACVENSYVTAERQTIKAGGQLLVVAEAGAELVGLAECFSPDGATARIAALCAGSDQLDHLGKLGVEVQAVADTEALPDEGFDDIVYFGCNAQGIEALNDKLAARGILAVILAGRRIGRPVSVGVGRLHYGFTRWIGTTTDSAADAYAVIPANGDLRPDRPENEKVLVMGAGGPMGQMHTLRAICSGGERVSVTAGDIDDARLEALRKKAQPAARRLNVDFRLVNTRNEPDPLAGETFSYFALMAPLPQLLSEAVARSAEGAIINIFAGIPAPTRHPLDLDAVISKRCFMYGTSGSRISDMQIVLQKVAAGQLDTNASVDAICGMAGAADGIAAVRDRRVAGKIIVYPALREVGLIALSDLGQHFPTAAAKLAGGLWTAAAEAELLADTQT